MAVATLSAMPSLTKDDLTFDLADYLICKAYLAPKDRQIARQCASATAGLTAAGPDGIRILDVGSGEGSQTERICRELAKLRWDASGLPSTLTLDCVEPCPTAGRYLREVGSSLQSLGQKYYLHPETIEEFLVRRTEEYEAVLACHSLYHFPREGWSSLIEQLLQVLSTDGVLLVDLVSRESDIYRILDSLQSQGSLEGLPRTFESCGDLCFGEDLAPLLGSLDCVYDLQRVSSTIVVPRPDVSDLRAHLDCGAAESSRIVRFLSFMFRLEPADLLATARDMLRGLLADGARTLRFRSIDCLYLLRRKP